MYNKRQCIFNTCSNLYFQCFVWEGRRRCIFTKLIYVSNYIMVCVLRTHTETINCSVTAFCNNLFIIKNLFCMLLLTMKKNLTVFNIYKYKKVLKSWGLMILT